MIIKFPTAKDPLFNSTRICKVEDHYRQEHRCDCVRTGRTTLGQNLKGQKGLQGTESALSVVNFVAFFMLINLVFLNLACSRRSDSGERCEVKRSVKK